MKSVGSYRKILNLTGQQVKKIDSVSRNIQLIADLSYSDIIIYCAVKESSYFVVVAAAKPNTTVSVRPDNVLGQIFKNPPMAVVKAFNEGKRVEDQYGMPDGTQVKIRAVPIKEKDRVLAVMTSERRVLDDWRPSEMEQMYMGAADDLIQMIEDGVDVGIDFPTSKEAGDGLLRVDPNGVITYASPNAVTIYRRLGVEDTLIGRSVNDIGLDENTILSAIEDRKAIRREVTEKGMTVIKRAIPLIKENHVKGIVAIIRDVTDVWAREQQLKIKEATIREIHHRVKNNLQTIASLLRLQSRRMTSPEATQALLESVGRISSIAAVHEILSQSGSGTLDFREIAANITCMIKSGLIQPDKEIKINVEGMGGEIPSPIATSLALVLTELVQNAVKHAFTGRATGNIVINLERQDNVLVMTISDDGIGLPKGFDILQNSNLGLQIVHTLVVDELRGNLDIHSNNGTRVTVRVLVEGLASI
ncbi:MAG: histidine kinase N-terminal domain-containing protein [Actinomycetota bacterium]|nr:histidine kinase N-terminal domain-containing protein [Actinomycetota bacterium]